MSIMSRFQKIACNSYEGGEFAFLIDIPNWPEEIPNLGDTLFAFIMLELAEGEDSSDLATAIKRMGTAVTQLRQVITGLSDDASGTEVVTLN